MVNWLFGSPSQNSAPAGPPQQPETALRVQSSVAGTPLPFFHGQQRLGNNLLWSQGFLATAVAAPQASGGGGGGGGKNFGGGGSQSAPASVSYTYSTNVMFGLCEGPLDSILMAWNSKTPNTLASLNATTSLGGQGQVVWSWLASSYPNQAIGYSAQAWVGCNPLQLGSSSSIPTLNFEARSSISKAVTESYTPAGASSYAFTPTYFSLTSSVAEQVVVPFTGPYTVTPVNASAANALPVILGSISSASLPDVGGSSGVVYTLTGSPLTYTSGAPSTGQYNLSGGVYTFASGDAGAEVTIIDLALSPGVEYTSSGLALVQVLGAPGQGQFSVSVQAATYGQYQFSSADSGTAITIIDVVDADPTASLIDFLSNPRYGVGFPAGNISTLTLAQQYFFALGLFISPMFSSQSAASSYLTDFATGLNGEFVWSAGLLNFVPYGDEAASGNGYTYTPPAAAGPLYSLADDDYLPNEGSIGSSAFTADDPVVGVRQRPSDNYNDVKVEALDRGNSYNPVIVEATDDAGIALFGLRTQDTKTLHFFASPITALTSAQLQLGRLQVRNQFGITIPWYYVMLDPMDIIQISDSKIAPNEMLVRVLEITENQQDWSLSLLVEEYLAGAANTPQYGSQPQAGYIPNYNVAPGNANAPVMFEPPIIVGSSGGPEVDIAVSGTGANWGGCQVWVSSDGDTYERVSITTTQARMGVLTSILPSGSDPDLTNTLAVDLTESVGTLLSGTQNDADLYHTLCYVDGELLSYENAALSSTYHYNLTYLRRGAYGTTIAAHANGSSFVRFDQSVIAIPYTKEQVGTKLYVKLLSYNLWSGGLQSLASVDPYTYTIQGPPVPGQVQNFSVTQNGVSVVFSWSDLADFGSLKGYDIGYAPQGTTDWGEFTFLTQVSRTTEMTNASVPPGTWVFGIRAHSVTDQLGLIATVNLVVTNSNVVIYQQDEAPNFLGTLLNGTLHWTGVLTPNGSKTVDQYVPVSAPGTPSLSAATSGALAAATYYVETTFVDATGETVGSAEASIAVLVGQVPVVAAPASPPASAVGWNAYVATSSNVETLQNTSPLSLAVNWQMPNSGLIAGAALPSANSTGWQVFDEYVPDPVASMTYTTSAIDSGLDASLRAFATWMDGLGFNESGSPQIDLFLDTWLTGESDPLVFNPWTSGTLTLRYARFRIVETINELTGQYPAWVDSFVPTLDTSPMTEQQTSVVISAGGSTVTFSPAFHNAPFVQGTVIGSTSLTVTVSNVTATSCVVNVWNTLTQTSVGGTVNLTITGE